jgi:hypothetical protein
MRQKRGRWWVAGILIVLLGTSSFFLEKKRSALNRDLEQVRLERGMLASRRSQIDRIREMRIAYIRNRYFIHQSKKYLAGLIRFVRYLEGEIAPSLSLGRLVVDPDPGAFRFILSADLRSTGKIDARSRCDLLLERLETFADLDRISSTEKRSTENGERCTVRGSVIVP